MTDEQSSGSGLKILEILAVAGVIGGLGWYFINRMTGAKGGGCNDPASPCYQAMQPYLQEYQTCATNYTKLADQYNTNNAQANVARTSDQIATLKQYQDCMDRAAAGAAAAVKPFTPDPVAEVSSMIQVVALDGIITYAAFKWGPTAAKQVIDIIKASRGGTPILSGASTATTAESSVARLSVEAGEINPVYASTMQQSIQDTLGGSSNAVAEFTSQLEADQIFTAEEAASFEEADMLAISTEESDVLATLAEAATV